VSNRTAGGQLRTVLALLTIATLLAMPFSAFGAKGTSLTAMLDTLADKASVGNLLAFEVSFENTGTSAIQQFRFDGRVEGAGSADFHAATHPACGAGSASNAVACQFGSLAAGANVEFVVMFTAVAQGKVQFTGEFSGDARTGTPGRKQDTWATDKNAGKAEIFPAGGEFYGGWITDWSGGPFPTVGTTQKTTVAVPPRAAFAVAIGHSNANITCDGTTYTGHGQAVELSVANGKSPVTMTIVLKAPGLNANNANFVHWADDGSCTFPPKVVDCLNSGAEECYDTRSLSGGRVEIVAQLSKNGRAKIW
jgi:hypothetical protein